VSAYGASQAGKGAGRAPAPVDIFAQKKIKAVKGQRARGGRPAIAAQPERLAPSLATQQATGLTDYYGQNIPGFLELSKRFGPELMGQMFGQTGQFLGGVGGQPGFNALQLSSGQQAGKTIGQLREEELRQMTGQAGLTRGLMESLSPEQAAAVAQASRTAAQAQGLESDFVGRASGIMGQYGSKVGNYDSSMAQQLAQEAFGRRGVLSPEEQRASQQRARQASAASGRIGGNAAIAAEIQNREAAQAARRGEAATFGQEALRQSLAGGAQQLAERQLGFGQMFDIEQQRGKLRDEAERAGVRSFDMARQFYTDPGLAALQNAPLSYTAGSKNLSAAMIGGPESSGTFDYNMPLNMAMSQAGAQNESNMANYQIQSANAQAKAKMYSDIGSSLMGAGFNMAGAGGGVSAPNTMSMGNMGTYAGNLFKNATNQPMRAYTV
jgi:hypothetical protein